MLCRVCQNIDFNEELEGGQLLRARHHADITALRAAVDEGCELCHVLLEYSPWDWGSGISESVEHLPLSLYIHRPTLWSWDADTGEHRPSGLAEIGLPFRFHFDAEPPRYLHRDMQVGRGLEAVKLPGEPGTPYLLPL